VWEGKTGCRQHSCLNLSERIIASLSRFKKEKERIEYYSEHHNQRGEIFVSMSTCFYVCCFIVQKSDIMQMLIEQHPSTEQNLSHNSL